MPGIYDTLYVAANHKKLAAHQYEYGYIVAIFQELIITKEYEVLRVKHPQLPADPLPVLRGYLKTFQENLTRLVADMDKVIQNPYQFACCHKAYVNAAKFYLELNTRSQESFPMLWPLDLKEVWIEIRSKKIKPQSLQNLEKCFPSILAEFFSYIAALADEFSVCLVQYFHQAFLRLNIEFPNPITHDAITKFLSESLEKKTLLVQWNLSCAPVPTITAFKDSFLQTYISWTKIYSGIVESSKAIDQLVDKDNVVRISYLNQSLDWGVRFYGGHCAQDIKDWVETNALVSCPANPLTFPKDPHQFHTAPLPNAHRKNIPKIAQAGIMDLLGPISVPFGDSEHKVLHEDIAVAVQTLTKNRDAREITIIIHPQNLYTTSLSHAVGVRIVDKGIRFRDVNQGEFLIKDPAYLVRWLEGYFNVTGYHIQFKYFCLQYRPLHKPVMPNNSLYDLARKSLNIIISSSHYIDLTKRLELNVELLKTLNAMPLQVREPEYFILEFLIRFSARNMHAIVSKTDLLTQMMEMQNSVTTAFAPVTTDLFLEVNRLHEKMKKNDVSGLIETPDLNDSEILQYRGYVQSLPISEADKRDIILLVGSTDAEVGSDAPDSSDADDNRDKLDTKGSAEHAQIAAKSTNTTPDQAMADTVTLATRTLLSRFTNPRVKQFLAENPAADIMQLMKVFVLEIDLIRSRLCYVICRQHEHKMLDQAATVRTILFQYPGMQESACSNLVLEYLGENRADNLDQSASLLSI